MTNRGSTPTERRPLVRLPIPCLRDRIQICIAVVIESQCAIERISDRLDLAPRFISSGNVIAVAVFDFPAAPTTARPMARALPS